MENRRYEGGCYGKTAVLSVRNRTYERVLAPSSVVERTETGGSDRFVVLH